MNQIDEMLEMKQIKMMCQEFALTEKAIAAFDDLKPILNECELKLRMKETTEARKLLDSYGNPPFSETKDIRRLADESERGVLLTINELERIRKFLVSCMRMKKYLLKSMDFGFAISEYGTGMADLDVLKEEIERCIRYDKIDDFASKELKDIRKKIDQTNSNIRLRLESILKSKKEYFSESFVSNRNGHFTLPVKKEHKLNVSGSVIDVSSSGSTLFIEPTSVAKLKEEWERLKLAEENEERRILYMLSSCVSDFKNEIILNLDYIEELDYIFAKAKLSAKMRAIEPKLNIERKIKIVNGRHPLMDFQTCVPLNIEFGREIRGVVITGPNTGGKTVALKTVGLFSVMAQCGLHLPCDEAEICMNSNVLCDIGDGQSISENLSTFSAHIKNVIEIMKVVGEDSLVLMDELGSGTDPSEGMGIAISILDELRTSQCNFIVTTHYPEVKQFADKEKGIINARMSFDRESLKPLYSMEMGMSGESCALYIAKYLGMSQKMLKRAYEETYEKRQERDGLQEKPNIEIYCDLNDSDVQPKKMTETLQKEQKKTIDTRAASFQMGDSVMVYPQKKLGIVFQKADSKGQIGVQIQKNKIFVNHKRLKLKASAKELYPEDYDFSIIFDSIETRKARHQMERKYVKGVEIKSEK